ncbi:MAG: methyl-accepting chemotaxis protein [Treponemataceae bacterium]|nr:methyl-accepting chemotaxis protein [Treponemataceae bacterium]
MMSFLDKLKNIDKKTKKIFRVSFIPMVLLALISCVIFSYMIVNAINAAVNTDVADTVQKVCDNINNAITQDVAVLNDVRLMSSENLSEKYITDMLYNVDENLTLSDSIYVVTTDFPKSGFFANNNGWIPEDSYDQHQRPWYEIPLKNDGKTAYIDPYIDEDTNQAVISITRAINSKGKTAGVAGIDIYLERLFKIFADLKISKSSKIYMLSSEGLYLTHQDQSKILKENYFNESKIGKTSGEWLNGEKQAFIRAGLTYYGVAKIGNTPWYIVAEGNMADFGGQFMIALVVVILILLAVSFVFAIYVERFVMSFQAKEKELGEKLFTETQSLVVTAKETAATSQDQSAAVKEIVATMEDSNTLSENIATKITDASKVAQKTSSDVNSGAAALSVNIEKLHDIFEANQTTIKGIKSLGDKIENIWDIVSLINSVADQAKIIAFNAELEAASAGEAGKNFHIVASEIRRLADGIIDGTREIKGKITEIQQSSDSLIIASESGTAKINEGCESANELEARFNSIKNAAEITVDSASNITSIIQQQAAASSQILITLKQIAAGVSNFSAATETLSDSAQKLKTISVELNASMDSIDNSKDA